MGTELDYLYAYHDILLKAMQVEAELDKVDELIKKQSTVAADYFTPFEIIQLKQSVRRTVEDLLNNFRNGHSSPSTAKSQLEELSKKLHILFSEKAA